MTHETVHQTATRPPFRYWIAAGLGLVWNGYGVMQFVASVRATPDSLLAAGLSAEQAAVMTEYPVWMTAAFGIGVVAGVIGAGLLLLRQSGAMPVLLASLVAYLVLYAGDITEGVFAAMGPPQVVILTFVVAVAAGLVALTATARGRGWLG